MNAIPFALTCGRLLLVTGVAAMLPSSALRAAEPAGMARRLIEHLHLQRIPQEGPWFSVTYVSADQLDGAALPARYHGQAHAAGSAIYCVLTAEDFSALHRLQTDETWHFYGGDPIEMLLLYPDGHGETVTLGANVFAGQRPQFTVPRGVWQGSAPLGRGGPEAYSFVADQLAPAFDYADFEIGYRDELQRAYPAFAAQVARLTRGEFATRRPAAPATQPTPPPSATPVGAAAPVVFAQEDVQPVEVAPGMVLRELVGRVARARSERLSVAAFTLASGQATATSHNLVSEETFLVTRGHGRVLLDGREQAVAAGSVVMIPAGVKHALRADENEGLEFYAVEAPAYRPEDYVAEPTQGGKPIK